MFERVAPGFLVSHLLWPLAVFCVVAVGLELSDVDITLTSFIYAWGDSSWVLHDAWVTSTLIHDDGRKLVMVLAAVLLLLLISSHFVQALKPYRKGLWYLTACVVTAGVVINLLKEMTHVYCPWDLLRYGGDVPYIKKFEIHPKDFRNGSCFPAGHASAGYGWLGLYYFTRDLLPRWQRATLISVLALGLVFGVAQQLRGAHFLSHDVWTLGLCWLSATVIYLAFGKLSAQRD